ncbi:chemotaxis protein [Alkalispirochaeta odontotermitis]|nr:chemotaxis protein [Alkalispirochaeta odontotermitis]CAB1076946.1 Serine phosphatase RsbU, regulator of sigma subunit [Olavius algarvensis Delta 1 endosymbiont]
MGNNNSDTESILLVDDNPTNLQVLFQTLEGVGCKLLIAKNGNGALAIAGKALPDLILLDIMMPDIDGYEVCRRLKTDPATADIPVIFLSALGETEDKVKGLQLGAVDYITKPFQLDEVIARVNTHLTIHRLKREVESQKDQLEHELEVVSEVQRKLLPKKLPEIEGFKLAAHYETSRYAGGDYYDIIQIPDNRWGFLIADAEGHSAPAAVLMAMTCALFRAYPNSPGDPAAVLHYLNEHLCKVADPSFMTALYAVYDSGRQTMRIVRAGQPLPMLYQSAAQKAYELDCPGVYPLGIEPYGIEIPVTEVKLTAGDRFLVYTDGLSERFNAAGDTYGEERLLKPLAAANDAAPQDVVAVIMADVEQFAGDHPADDDQALLLGIVD